MPARRRPGGTAGLDAPGAPCAPAAPVVAPGAPAAPPPAPDLNQKSVKFNLLHSRDLNTLCGVLVRMRSSKASRS